MVKYIFTPKNFDEINIVYTENKEQSYEVCSIASGMNKTLSLFSERTLIKKKIFLIDKAIPSVALAKSYLYEERLHNV